MSSIRIPASVPPPSADAVALNEGLGYNGFAVIKILAHRNLEQRLRIKEAYENLYQEDLMQRIKSKLHFNFKKAMLLWMSDPASRDALILNDVLRNHITRFFSSKQKWILIEMLCLRSAEDIHYLSETYSSIFHRRSLLEDILASTGGFCRTLFPKYLVANHDTNGEAGMELSRTASEEAQALHEAIEGRAGHFNDDTFLRILTTKSGPELISIFNTYKDVHGKPIYKAIRKGAVEDTETTVREIVKFISNPPRFFAKALYKSMKGLGTDDDSLIRLVVTRAEVDMKVIKSEFISKYKVSLDRTIASDTSGNYRKFLLALIGANYT